MRNYNKSGFQTQDDDKWIIMGDDNWIIMDESV